MTDDPKPTNWSRMISPLWRTCAGSGNFATRSRAETMDLKVSPRRPLLRRKLRVQPSPIAQAGALGSAAVKTKYSLLFRPALERDIDPQSMASSPERFLPSCSRPATEQPHRVLFNPYLSRCRRRRRRGGAPIRAPSARPRGCGRGGGGRSLRMSPRATGRSAPLPPPQRRCGRKGR